MSRWLSLAPLGLLLALAVYFAFGLTEDSRTVRSVLIDKPMPAFDLPSFGHDGETVSNATLAGRVSLVNIFASWCITCRVEHPVLLRLSKENRVPIYGLAWKDKPDELKAWLEELGNPYTAIADDARGRTAIDLGVSGAPETYVIDKQGVIRYKQIGPLDDDTVATKILPLVKELEVK